MPDRRKHRGSHPQDVSFFGPKALPALRRAVDELSWLLSRGYNDTSALKLVGDRHALTARQRKAVHRGACADEAIAGRRERKVGADALAGATVEVDGFNVVIITESLLGGGAVFRGRDGALRDLASIHGTYRLVQETPRALTLLGGAIATAQVASVRWLLDRPVSNSGRLKTLMLELAAEHGWPWSVELDANPDRALAASEAIVATGDSWILDHCARWIDLPGLLSPAIEAPWIVELGALPLECP